jgi:biopolymer transport protein TolR
MHGHHAAEDEPMAEMNLIPLIDIALTLLIILMVTSAFIHRPGVSLHLPQSATREGAPETSKDMIISVSADGSYRVDGKLETTTYLQAKLLDVASRDRESRVLVKGDRDVPYARIMEVMDIVRQAGLTHIVLPTDPKATQSAAVPPGAAVPAPTGTGDNTLSAPPTGSNTTPSTNTAPSLGPPTDNASPARTPGDNAPPGSAAPTDRPNANNVPGAAPDTLSNHNR